jgi:hypothetical protein
MIPTRKEHNGNHKQDVDCRTDRVGADHAKQPGHEQNDG